MYIAEKELAIETQLWPGMVELMMQSVDLPDAGTCFAVRTGKPQSACRDPGHETSSFLTGQPSAASVHRICAGCPVSVEMP